MPIATTWIPEIIILNEVRERQISYGITYMWNLKYSTNEPLCKTERDHEHKESWLPRRKMKTEGWTGSLADANNKVLIYSTGTVFNTV